MATLLGMPLLAQLTDLHLVAGEEDHGASERLEQAVAALVPHAPDALLLSGDLVDDGSPAAYAKVKQALTPLGELPIHVLPGNHDDREALQDAFGLERSERVHGTAQVGALRLVLCDSVRPGRTDGALPPAELGWLDAALREAPDVPTLVAVHHPPARSGIAFMDALGLPEPDRRAFAAVVAGHPQVQLVASGHVHVAFLAQVGGRPLLGAPSTARALALDLRAERRTAFAMTSPPPGFVLHQLDADGLRSHVSGVRDTEEEAPAAAARAALDAAGGGADLRVVEVPAERRFVLARGNETVGLITYHRRGDVVSLDHTEVPRASQGQGHASVLVRGALDQLRAAGDQVLPRCSYISAWLAEHPGYADLVPAGERDRFGL